MSKTVFSMLLLLGACTTDNSQDNFERWRVGEFQYSEKNYGDFIIDRQDSFQIEYLSSYDMVVRFKINWLSDSIYSLSYDTILKNPSNVSLDHIQGLIKTCTITSVNDNSYIEISTSNLSEDTNYTAMFIQP